MVFLAGVFYPVDTLPLWTEILSKSNPVTYGVDAIRQVFLGADPAAAGLGVTMFDRTMGLGAEIAIVGVLGCADAARGHREPGAGRGQRASVVGEELVAREMRWRQVGP